MYFLLSFSLFKYNQNRYDLSKSTEKIINILEEPKRAVVKPARGEQGDGISRGTLFVKNRKPK
jgi:hypothetical protein